MRKAGEVPAVLYGHKEETVALQVPAEELEALLRHRTRILELHLGNHKESVLLKDVQYNALGDEIVHADLLRVAMDEVIRLKVPVLLKGTPKAEHSILQQPLDAVEVECLPANIPESIVFGVVDLQIGQSVKVSDLAVPAGVKILTEPDAIVASLTLAQEEVVAEAAPAVAAAAAEPEVIGRKPEEAAEGEEEAEEGKKGA
jgi:large subunit ribosomal protein L25